MPGEGATVLERKEDGCSGEISKNSSGRHDIANCITRVPREAYVGAVVAETI